MMVQKDFSLVNHNTFGIDVKARYFAEVRSTEELIDLLRQAEYAQMPKLWLGGGSNMLLTGDVDALVIHLNLKGKSAEILDDHRVKVTAEAGENWHQFVCHTLENNWGGLENLSLIPGNVGTAPIQNIGAYGVEIKDCFHSLLALNLESLELEHFDAARCQFAYRDSFFKGEGKGKYVVVQVSFLLRRKEHLLKTTYGSIDQMLSEMEGPDTIQKVSKAVIAIRQSKLPDPKELGNSGSFFKNPLISKEQADALKAQFPDMPQYPAADDRVKLAAGWLIEQAGLKGYRDGDAGVHAKQALVLVNYGKASGAEVLAMAKHVQATVFRKFAVELEAEVNVI